MLVAPRYTGIEIPVFPPETEVIDIQCDQIPDKDKFVRAIRIGSDSGSVFDTLEDCLDASDKELSIAANHCQAQVIPHEWGLYKPQKSSDLSYYFRETSVNAEDYKEPYPLLPHGYILVAEVPKLQIISNLRSTESDIVKRGIQIYRESRQSGDLWYADNNKRQYVIGSAHASEAQDLWLIDPEPVLEIF